MHQGRDSAEHTTSLQHIDSDVTWSICSSSVISDFVAAYPGVKNNLERFSSKLPTVQATNPVRHLKNYVNRPLLEDRILRIYNTSYERQYLCTYAVIIGPEGAGKSSVIAHVLDEKPGVLYMSVSHAETSSSLCNKLLAASGERIDNSIQLDDRVLYQLFEQVAMKGHSITIVFQIDRWSKIVPIDVLYMVKSTAKTFAQTANVIVVLPGRTMTSRSVVTPGRNSSGLTR